MMQTSLHVYVCVRMCVMYIYIAYMYILISVRMIQERNGLVALLLKHSR